jgi:hypothetical protein
MGRTRDAVEAMRQRIDALEQQVAELSQALASARAVARDGQRLEQVAEQTARLSAAADATLHELSERAGRGGVARPRQQPELGKVHRAEVSGYLAVYFVGGRTNTIKILVGPDDPPTTCVGELNVTNDLNAYAGAVVRQGEYWTTQSRHHNLSGFHCMFTPLH